MIRILIIENNVSQRFHYQLVFEDDTYELQTVQWESEALEILNTKKIDAVILDLKLKDSAGLEFMEEILSRYAHLPIFINWAGNECADNFLLNTPNLEYFSEERKKYLTLKKNLDRIVLASQECFD